MTDEFFDNRTEVEVVATDHHQSRLQTVKPDMTVRGRIVLTLNYEIPRNTWEQGDTDAVDVLRRWLGDGLSADEAEMMDQIARLVEEAQSWYIEATK